jgi:hypothetical protein
MFNWSSKICLTNSLPILIMSSIIQVLNHRSFQTKSLIFATFHVVPVFCHICTFDRITVQVVVWKHFTPPCNNVTNGRINASFANIRLQRTHWSSWSHTECKWNHILAFYICWTLVVDSLATFFTSYCICCCHSLDFHWHLQFVVVMKWLVLYSWSDTISVPFLLIISKGYNCPD